MITLKLFSKLGSIVFLTCLFSIQSYSQNVGINTTGTAPDASAGLDVAFTDKGVLIPRVALTATNSASPITSPTTSLLVYNSATAGTSPNNVYPGYYFWDGTIWERFTTGLQRKFLPANVTNNNVTANTIADVTGLSFDVLSGVKYRFKFYITYTSAATTTGSRWCINGPTTSILFYQSEYPSSTTARAFNNSLTTYNVPTGSSGASGTNSNIAIIEGVLTPSANGTIIARFASEITSSAIIALASASYVEWEVLL
jgi:hypothetical protein